MVVYNITTKVSWDIHDQWLRWLQQEYIPRMLATRCFFESRILRLLHVDEEEGPTYAVQYHAAAEEEYTRYIREHASSLMQLGYDTWGERTVAFSTVMEVLH